MNTQIGKAAPDFLLFDTTKTQISLSQQKGSNVLLLFFPLAYTSICTIELCSVRDNLDKYNAANAKVFGISVDSLYTLAQFKNDQNLNFSLLSDFNKEVSKSYNVLYEEFSYGMKGVSKRAALVIDGAGIIQHQEILENASLQPDFGKIDEALERLTAPA